MLTVTQPPVESSLAGIARALVADGRGILAADESLPTIEKRFRTIDVESTEEARHSYRELLFTAPDVEQYISGVILFDGTTHQVDASGTPLVDVLTARGIIPGVKVDRGAKPLAGSPRETVTEGWMDCASASMTTTREVFVSRSGVRSSPSVTDFLRPTAFAQTRMLWLGTQRSRKKRGWSRSWSRRCSSTEITPSSGATT